MRKHAHAADEFQKGGGLRSQLSTVRMDAPPPQPYMGHATVRAPVSAVLWDWPALRPQVAPSPLDDSPNDVAAPEGPPDEAGAGYASEGGALGVTDAYDSYCGICRVLLTGARYV
jgi:hypothetical protein